MKKILSVFFALLFICASSLMVSCEKDDPAPNDQNNNTQTNDNAKLAGTSWNCQIEHAGSMQGVGYIVTLDATLDFFDTEKGEMYQYAAVEFPSLPNYNQSTDMTSSFTFELKGSKLTIHETWVDDETGETVEGDSECIYDESAESITMTFDDPDMLEMLGTNTYVFTKVK